MPTLEIAVDSVDSALAAARGGADRLELVATLSVGGVTPSLGKLLEIKEQVNLPVFVMVRPREADFLYTEATFREMLRDIKLFKEYGADGIVSGMLTPDGQIDKVSMAALRHEAGTLPFTCHRCFDMCHNLANALEDLIELGVTRVLTSGGKPTAPEGVDKLTELAVQAQGKIHLLAGSGVTPETLPTLIPIPYLNEYHGTGKKLRQSEMIFRGGATMSTQSANTEFQFWQTEESEVSALKALLT